MIASPFYQFQSSNIQLEVALYTIQQECDVVAGTRPQAEYRRSSLTADILYTVPAPDSYYFYTTVLLECFYLETYDDQDIRYVVFKPATPKNIALETMLLTDTKLNK